MNSILSITKEQLLQDRETLLKQVSHIDAMLESWYGWKPISDPTCYSSAPSVANPPTETKRVTKVSYADESREWLKEIHGDVTVNDFGDWLKARFPDEIIQPTSLNRPVKQLVQEGKLKLKQAGKGKRASVYTLPDSIFEV